MELAQLPTRTLATPANTGMPAAIVTGDVVLLRLFVACGSSAPVRIAHESDAAVWGGGWGWGTLEAPSVQRHRLPQPRELWPCQSFPSFRQLAIRRPL